MPARAAHEALFGSEGCRVLVVKPPPAVSAPLLRHFRVRRADGVAVLGERIAAELTSQDAAAQVAVE